LWRSLWPSRWPLPPRHKVAQAVHLSCGDTITENATLDSDLNCVGTKGLIIGADGIKVNLNGHTITGTAAGFAHGIDNAGNQVSDPAPGGFDNVTIKNGTIVGFEQGIRAVEVSGFTIKNVTVRDQTSSSAIDILNSENVIIKNSFVVITAVSPFIEAIRLESVDGVKVKNVHVVGGNVGVNFACSPCPDPDGPTNGVIINSTFVNNGNGIFLAETTRAKVKNNVVTGSVGTAILVGLKCFVGSFPAVTNVKIFRNVVSGNQAAGITLCTADNSKVFRNRVTGNVGKGIRLLGSSIDNKIKRNIAIGNTDDDMFHDGSSTPNTWKKNTCGTSSGAEIDCP